MKLNKIIISLVVLSVGLFSGATPVNAVGYSSHVPYRYTHMRSHHYVAMDDYKYRVKILKPTRVYRIHCKTPLYKSTLSKYKLLKRGQKIYLYQPAANWNWVVWGKGLGKMSKSGNFQFATTCGPQNYSWFKVIGVKKW